MILNVRGTHGSGKSTLVKRFLTEANHLEPKFIRWRKRPIGYVARRGTWDGETFLKNGRGVFVPGHYEAPCGGCDTISDLDDMFLLIKKYAEANYDVVFEGIVAQHSTSRLLDLVSEGYGVGVLYLDIPVDLAISSVQTRRDDRGEVKEFAPDNVRKEAENSWRAVNKLAERGIPVWFGDREGIYRKMMSELGWQ
jgi:hypothetical protein